MISVAWAWSGRSSGLMEVMKDWMPYLPGDLPLLHSQWTQSTAWFQSMAERWAESCALR